MTTITKEKPPLKFAKGNAKLSDATGTFSLPAGWSCPFAKDCLSKAEKEKGRITDGKDMKFRCFAASQESAFPNVRRARWANFDALKNAKTIQDMANIIQNSLPSQSLIRVHVSGDFYSEDYFLAWVNVAYNNPNKVFYGYTKALPYLVKYKTQLPPNFRFTASKGGTKDNLIKPKKLKFAEVVFSVKEAEDKKLELDHDDSHAIFGTESFGLLLHGTQKPNTDANTAWKKLKAVGLTGYNKKDRRPTDHGMVKIHVFKSGKTTVPA